MCLMYALNLFVSFPSNMRRIIVDTIVMNIHIRTKKDPKMFIWNAIEWKYAIEVLHAEIVHHNVRVMAYTNICLAAFCLICFGSESLLSSFCWIVFCFWFPYQFTESFVTRILYVLFFSLFGVYFVVKQKNWLRIQ